MTVRVGSTAPDARMPRTRGVQLVLAGLAIAFVSVVLLLPYAGRQNPGMSFDTPYYVWRTRAVSSEGVDVLTTIPTGTVPERPGVPVIGAMVGAVTGADALTYTVILRAIAAVAIGLAAGAMAVEALGESRWAFPAFIAGLGASAAVVGTAVGSLDQLLVDVLLVAVAAVIPLVVAGRRGVVGVAVLFAAATATHWIFAALFLFLLVAVVPLLLPASRRAVRSGTTWGATPAIRLVRIIFVMSVTAMVTLALLPDLPHRLPPLTDTGGKLARLAAYELSVLLPLAALGAVLTFRRSEGARRTTLALLGVWAVIVPIAMVVSPRLDTPIKLFRVAPFALGVPALTTLCFVTIAERVGSRLGRAGPFLGALFVAGGLVWVAGSPVSAFGEAQGALIADKMAQARSAGAYLDGVHRVGRPVIFLTVGAPRLLDRIVRSGVPPDLVDDTWVFVGQPADLERQAPIDDPERQRLSRSAQKWWRSAWPEPSQVFAREPIVIRILPTGQYNSGGAENEVVVLAPGVELVDGPAPSPSFEPAPPFREGWVELLLLTALALAVLGVTGGGWARTGLDISGLAALGIAPASGVAMLVLAGTAASRLGIPLRAPSGWLVVLVTATSGWIVFALGRGASRNRRATAAQGSPVG